MQSAKAGPINRLLTPGEICHNQPLGVWFCFRTSPKREHIAASCLRPISGVEVLCLRVRLQKRTSRGPVWFREPMFPSHLFARFNYATLHRRVGGQNRVIASAQFRNRIALLPDPLISEIRRRTDDNQVVEVNQTLHPGAPVEITRGPFPGLNGSVTRLIAAEGRVQMPINGWGALFILRSVPPSITHLTDAVRMSRQYSAPVPLTLNRNLAKNSQ
jgi:hypothetical protein